MVQQQTSGTSSYSLFNMYEVLQTVFQHCGNLPELVDVAGCEAAAVLAVQARCYRLLLLYCTVL